MKLLKPLSMLGLVAIPCALMLTGCGVSTTYVSPTVTVDQITTSNIEEAINSAVLSVVSVYVEGNVSSGINGMAATSYSAGSGVICSLDKDAGDAYIITNYHVVYDENYTTSNGIASKIVVELYGSEETYIQTDTFGNGSFVYGSQVIECEYVGGSLEYDLAVLKVTDSEILRNSAAKQVEICAEPAHLGQTTIAIGNPLGYGISATTGIVSVESEYIQYSDFYDVIIRCIRTDAPINSGNSGGGLFDEKGRLLGIVNAGNDSAENMGDAIPVALVTNVVDNILYQHETYGNQKLSVYNFGAEVYGSNSTAVYDEEVGLTFIKEDIVVTAVSGDAAQNLQVGDKIVSVSLSGTNIEFSRAFEFEEFLLDVRPGDQFDITVVRSGGLFTFTITASNSSFSQVN